jgi:hypothetical protein
VEQSLQQLWIEELRKKGLNTKEDVKALVSWLKDPIPGQEGKEGEAGEKRVG